MCNTLPAHLLEPHFLDAVIELAEEAGGLDTLPKLMCSGLAANLLPRRCCHGARWSVRANYRMYSHSLRRLE